MVSTADLDKAPTQVAAMFDEVSTRYDVTNAVLSAGTLVVAAAQNFWNLNIDGAVGLIISLVVLKAGFEGAWEMSEEDLLLDMLAMCWGWLACVS